MDFKNSLDSANKERTTSNVAVAGCPFLDDDDDDGNDDDDEDDEDKVEVNAWMESSASDGDDAETRRLICCNVCVWI